MWRLDISVKKPKRVDLLDGAIPTVKGRVEWRRLETETLWTPAGFPLKVFVEIGPPGDSLVIYSADTELPNVSAWTLHEAILLPSTEELLPVAVGEHR